MRGEATPTIKTTLSVPSVPREASTVLSGLGAGAVVQRLQTRTAGQKIHNLVPFQALSPVYPPAPVSPPHSSTMPPNIQLLVDFQTLHVPTQSVGSLHWPVDLQQPSGSVQQQTVNLEQPSLDLISTRREMFSIPCERRMCQGGVYRRIKVNK